MTDQQDDLVTVLVNDHRNLEQMLDTLVGVVGQSDRQAVLSRQLIEGLVCHGVTEELHLYPLVRETLSDGEARADREISEHLEAERVMRALEGCEPGESLFDQLLGQLASQVRNHLQEEEHELLPRLSEQARGETLHELGRQALRTMQRAPERAATGVGLVDAVRDAVSGPRGFGARAGQG